MRVITGKEFYLHVAENSTTSLEGERILECDGNRNVDFELITAFKGRRQVLLRPTYKRTLANKKSGSESLSESNFKLSALEK